MLPRPWSLGLGLAAALLTACSRPSDSAASATDRPASAPITVRAAPAETRRIERSIVVTGSLLPIDETPVAVKVPGRLEVIAVDLGSFVRQGNLIARQDDADYQLKLRQSAAALGQARARVGLPLEGDSDAVQEEDSSSVKEARAVLDEARANRERIQALTQQGILSQAEFETAAAAFTVALSRHEEALEEARIRVAQLRRARAEYDLARQQLADTRILAPFDGAVQVRRASIGQYLTAGDPVVVLVRTDPLRLRVEVPERDAPRVRIGQRVVVSVEGDLEPYEGEVKRLSPAIVEGSRTLVVEADVSAPGRLRPGSFARAQIVTLPDAEALVVPPDAIVTFAGIEKVFVIEDGRAVERRVHTGDRASGWVEISHGLKPGDQVVLGPGNLQAGQAVSQGENVPVNPSAPAQRTGS